MDIIADIPSLRARLKRESSIAFVPTMGGLHEGHLSLADFSHEHNNATVVSIFVNPKQFNDPDDLQRYPRPIEEDLRLLINKQVDVLFLPDAADIYPSGFDTHINFDPGPAAKLMEGKFRPGHFSGMAEVVYRLISIVMPDKMYMGQKDYQQLMIVRKMLADMQLPVVLEMCPIVREPNGLAMSSRNELLSNKARQGAAITYSTLMTAQRLYEEGEPVEQIKILSKEALKNHGFDPEYFEIVDGITLESIQSMEDSQFVIALCAVKIEGVRLIDNAIWTRSE